MNSCRRQQASPSPSVDRPVPYARYRPPTQKARFSPGLSIDDGKPRQNDSRVCKATSLGSPTLT